MKPSLSWLLPASVAVQAVTHGSDHIHRDAVSSVVKHGINYTVYEHAATNSSLEIVANSGICETTPGVRQYSGYLSVGEDMNMFFWFFEARQNPETAPLTAWLNGGPGCSSMIGLFQENGPCRFVHNETTPSLNPYSWNNHSNMLYIDQPIGVGFSFGNDPVDSTVSAAPYVWKLLQAFYTHFPEYESREFHLFTESYGGHYGPAFAKYIQAQNRAIASQTLTGEPIQLVSLGINNGWFDSSTQEYSYITYSLLNSYRALINVTAAVDYGANYRRYCSPALDNCTASATDEACREADAICAAVVDDPLVASGDFDVYDIRRPADDPDPPSTYSVYLHNQTVRNAIGARSTYQECPQGVFDKFAYTGDNARSFLPALSDVVQTGINVLLWAGDADWICNWFGVQAVANAVNFSQQDAFRRAPLQSYTVDGVGRGEYKSAGNFTFLRVFEAGHEVPYYQPETALQVFSQMVKRAPIFST
ncbi:putative carboxypeptidase S1 [Aspergillus heteromorphus CBS 117.55]|uniref:Carboxypeptidase n=1 Tax=Aspergillus heteromorphus CBS 117.55 TaxID=1448321 RepID=A0A317WXZ8_9EURO|nr:putative carboxypeptidase S1 [Aspergillus heteromorphus CBS 117.55]PWY90212.1 putative carboxypeptidase S1 [Aspergillus heteromorphus CBS 117.55]